jgi:hypothetical protein
VTNFAGLAAMRVMVGIFEAGLIPGMAQVLLSSRKKWVTHLICFRQRLPPRSLLSSL